MVQIKGSETGESSDRTGSESVADGSRSNDSADPEGSSDPPDVGTSASRTRYERSQVVLVDRFDEEVRPLVVLNTDELPNAGEQYLGAPLTVERSESAVALDPDDWVAGEMDRRSYALASDVTAFHHWNVDRCIGVLGRRPTTEIARRVARYLGLV